MAPEPEDYLCTPCREGVHNRVQDAALARLVDADVHRKALCPNTAFYWGPHEDQPCCCEEGT